MFKEMEFRVLLQHSEKGVKNVSRLLREHGFIVDDLRQSEIIMTSDNSKVSDIYVLCCIGREWRYKRFKKKFEYTEIIYEGYKTLC